MSGSKMGDCNLAVVQRAIPGMAIITDRSLKRQLTGCSGERKLALRREAFAETLSIRDPYGLQE